MVRTYPLKGRAGALKMLAGAALGQLHLKPLLSELPPAHGPDAQVVVLDFAGIDAVSSSYLKATVIHLLRAGMACSEAPEVRAASALPSPLNIYPAVANLSDDVREEIDDLFASIGQRLPCLEARAWNDKTIKRARLRGFLDPALRDTIAAMNRLPGQCTAQAIAAANPSAGIKETGWNNRLAELHRLRVIRRIKEGRFWIYEPIAAEVELG